MVRHGRKEERRRRHNLVQNRRRTQVLGSALVNGDFDELVFIDSLGWNQGIRSIQFIFLGLLDEQRRLDDRGASANSNDELDFLTGGLRGQERFDRGDALQIRQQKWQATTILGHGFGESGGFRLD